MEVKIDSDNAWYRFEGVILLYSSVIFNIS